MERNSNHKEIPHVETSNENWLLSNVVNPFLNTAALEPLKVMEDVGNAASKQLTGKEWLPQVELQKVNNEVKPWSAEFFAQNIASGLAMVVPYGVAGRLTAGSLRLISKSNALRAGAQAVVKSQKIREVGANVIRSNKTGQILGAGIYDFAKEPEREIEKGGASTNSGEHAPTVKERLANGGAGAASFAVYEAMNPLFHKGGTVGKLIEQSGLAKKLAVKAAGLFTIGAAGSAVGSATRTGISDGRMIRPEEIQDGILSGGTMNLLLPAMQHAIAKGVDRLNVKSVRELQPTESTTHSDVGKCELKTVDGEVLFTGEYATLREAVEAAIREKVSLKNAVLDGANLQGANLFGGNFEGARLNKACLTEVRAAKANFKGVGADGASFSNAYIEHADFEGASLNEACFVDARAKGTNFKGVEANGTNFNAAQIESANFEGASLNEARFSAVKGRGTNFKGVEANDASFGAAWIYNANFAGASVENAWFGFAHAALTNFEGIKADGASFNSAAIEHANFEGASLNEACLDGIGARRTNFKGVEAHGANFCQALLENANLEGAQLAEAAVYGASLANANLKGVCLGTVRGLETTNIELGQIDWEVNGPATGIDWRPTESMPEDYYEL